MGSAESILSNAQQQPTADDEITTVSERTEGVDPILERLKSLKIATPILKSPPPQTTDSSLTDILVRKPLSSSSVSGTLNPNVLLELFSLYRDWQEEKAKRISQKQVSLHTVLISQKQDEIEIKIETTDALAVKLLQRLNYSLSAMRTTAHHLSDVHPLEVEVGELKGRLTEVISNCDTLCKRITLEGPESLRSSVKPFADSDVGPTHLTNLQRILRRTHPSNEWMGSRMRVPAWHT
ncbi:uncharacterized protein LOC131243436 isoform X1 [Magnolia sinica]|uniref:uncharacterized protein LOC131243436 isoform X1 n=1 Tax=Magnolia sinica TaxID=86752 RepID=UPI0026595134|nr:uncharacterized protein LOC131243436 isoform X1 [Magnolia sinica]